MRWLILAAILAILGGVAVTFRLQQRILQQQSPEKPKPLAEDLNSTAENWHWAQTDGSRTVVEIWARQFDQAKDLSLIKLQDVTLHIFNKTGDQYDLVQSASAQFHPADKRLYSDGEVQITLDVPVQGPPAHNLVSIRSSGVNFDSATGKADTDRHASFTFENGDGTSLGASYDPTSHELHLKNQAVINWKANGPHAKPMKIEAGTMVYREAEAVIWLQPWARLTRDNTVVEAGPTTVKLQDGVIRSIDALQGHGTDRYPNRQLQYAAEHIWVDFDEAGDVHKIAGEPKASLVSTSDTSETTTTANRVDMEFATGGDESVLSKVLATGAATIVSKPAGAAVRNPQSVPDTRILRSQVIQIQMRPGGKEMEEMHTEAPGSLELLPNRPAQHHRRLEGDRLWINYGAQNQLQSFRATQAKTETDPTPQERARKAAVIVTRSRNLTAQFEPKGNQLSRMEQWDEFSYEQGDRKARAARGILESGGERITLDRAARVWDPTGSTSADVIHMEEKSGDFTADGHVSSSRLPDQKNKNSGMLSGDEPLEGMADHMTSADRNRRVHYEGQVVLWQGADRIRAQRVDIDRDIRRLTATGNVITTFLDSSEGTKKPNPKSQIPNPVFTVVRAPNLVYTDTDRLAYYYGGGVVLMRPGLEVQSSELRAWLAEQGSDSRLEHAVADGGVHIFMPERGRTGTGEHAEYYTAAQKVILTGGEAQLADTLHGNTTRGAELTYFPNDDRLLVNGTPGRPAVSHVRRK